MCGYAYLTCTKMIEDPHAPLVPDTKRRNKITEATKADRDSVREEMDALRMEAPFVPMVSKRRATRLQNRV